MSEYRSRSHLQNYSSAFYSDQLVLVGGSSFIFTKRQYRNVGKFNAEERALIKSTVAMLTIKRIPDNEIIKNIFDQTNKTISKQALSGIRKGSNGSPTTGIRL